MSIRPTGGQYFFSLTNGSGNAASSLEYGCVQSVAKALRKAVRDTFGDAALVQRCQVHTLGNVLDHLPDRQRPSVKASLPRACRCTEVAPARRLLLDLVRRLET